jgi:hypothetical protein
MFLDNLGYPNPSDSQLIPLSNLLVDRGCYCLAQGYFRLWTKEFLYDKVIAVQNYK